MNNPFKRRRDPFANDAWGGVIKSVRSKERRRPWVFRARWRWITALIVILIAGGAAFGAYLYYHLQGRVQVPIDEVEGTENEMDPFNVLLVGSDSRTGLTEDEKERLGADDESAEGAVTGERADTLILAHVDPETNHVTMVQFPRDLYVPIAGGPEDKIAHALLEGRRALVRTVEDLTGLDVNHYAQVNIAGFLDLVDAIGGVKLCLTEPIPFDEQTGIEVTEEELPVVEFDGERALRFVRARSVFATGDFARIQNQQKFLSAAISKVTSLGTLLDFGRVRKLYSAAGDYLKIDQGTGLTEIYDISKRFRSFTPDHYEAYTAPNLGSATNEAGSVVLPDEPTMEVLFEALADNESPAAADGVPDVDVSTIEVAVLNGTLEDGKAQGAAEALTQATAVQGESVDVVDVANADRFTYKATVIRYDESAEGIQEKIELIAAALPQARLKAGDTATADIEVIVGRKRFETEKIVQLTPLELPPPGSQPEECRREL